MAELGNDTSQFEQKNPERQSALEESRAIGEQRVKALIDVVSTVAGADRLVVRGAEAAGKEIGKAARELGDAALENVILPIAVKTSEAILWVDNTRDRLSQQAFERTDKYLESVNTVFDNEMKSTDKIGWKPLRNLVQAAIVTARSSRAVVAEVNDIIPRLVDRQSYGNDIKGTYKAVRAVVAEHSQAMKEQGVRSGDVQIRQALERNAKNMDKAEEHKSKAEAYRESAKLARGLA